MDVFKWIGGGGKAQRQVEDLHKLIETAREERGALSAMLTQVSTRSSKLGQVGKSLKAVDQKANSIGERLGEVLSRIDGLEARTKAFDEVEQRVEAMLQTAGAAQEVAEKLMAPDGDLQKHRQQVQHLSSQTLETRASVEALAHERAVLEDLRKQIAQSKAETRQAIEAAGGLRGEIEQVRGTAGQLGQDYAKLRDTTRAAREDASVATAAVKDIESRLGPLMQLQNRSETTEDKLTALNALAEHVTQKAKALESQKHTIDRATVEANRLNEMVWAMDVQIGKLNEGLKKAARGEEVVTRVEKLVEDVTARAEGAAKVRDEMAREAARFKKDWRALVDQMRAALDRVGQENKSLEVYQQRVGVLQSSVGEAESRIKALSARERHLAPLGKRVDGLSKAFEGLLARAGELSTKQADLESLGERLTEVDALSKQTTTQFEGLKQTRNDLDRLRVDIQDFHKSHAEAVRLRDQMGADRSALEGFIGRISEFKARTPEIEARLDTVLGKLAQAEEGTRQAVKLGEVVGELDAQATRVGARVQFLDKLDGRVDALHTLTVDIDGKLAEQLARRTELDTLQAQCDGVVAQMLEAHQKVEAVAALQAKVLPMENRVTILQDHLGKTQAQVTAVQQDAAALDSQEARLGALVESSRSLTAETEERLTQIQSLNQQLARTGTARDELVGELARVQASQRDAVSQTKAAEDQLKRVETIYVSLEQRRSQLAFAEKRVGAVEARLGSLDGQQQAVEEKIKALADRDAIVAAVRTQVEGVYEVSARSKADLEYVAAHRDEVAAVRAGVQSLLSMARDTEQKIASIEGRHAVVTDVQAKTNQIAHLLEDVRVNLEMVGEQKAVIDDVGERIARLEFVMREAQGTLQTLQHERELAERIEKNIQQLRGQTARGKKSPAKSA